MRVKKADYMTPEQFNELLETTYKVLECKTDRERDLVKQAHIFGAQDIINLTQCRTGQGIDLK